VQTISASELKAILLAVLDRVAETGEGVTILERGRAVAQLLPAVPRDDGPPQRALEGTVKILGDILAPAVDPDACRDRG
jgi:prevent-host-death family protein